MTNRTRPSIARILTNAERLCEDLTTRLVDGPIENHDRVLAELQRARNFRSIAQAVANATIPDRNGAGSRSQEVHYDMGTMEHLAVQFQADRDVDDNGNAILVYTYGTRDERDWQWHWPLASENMVRTWLTLDGARRYFLRRVARASGFADLVGG